MARRPWWNLEPCGTPAAYRRHYRKGQPPCQACRDAEGRRRKLSAAAADYALLRRKLYRAARDAGLPWREGRRISTSPARFAREVPGA